MKKIKLFMMLALLVMGASNAFGYSYRVIFEDGVINGGYRVTNATYVTSGDDAYVLTSSRRLSQNGGRIDGSQTYRASDYITPRTVDGNTAAIVVDLNDEAKEMGFDGVIYITYNSTVAEQTWEDDNFTYSNIYLRTDGRTGYYTGYGTNPYPQVTSKIYLGTEQVAISLKNTQLENVEIPLLYNNKRVSAIQKWGFCYAGEQTEYLPDCYNKNQQTNNNYDGDNDFFSDKTGTVPLTNNHKNDYLKTVTFEKNASGTSNLRSIGDYAFMSCTKLESVEIPSSVKYLGQGIFEADRKLTSVTFQTKNVTSGDKVFKGVDILTIRNFTFWMCTALQTLYLPDGIVFIEGQTSGAAMQYMTGLINLRLPNTLERVGPHFLCSAQSLRTLTIPASVTYLDGACFHGCESLESVYLLGPAATLKNESTDGATTFSANGTCCADPVHDCHFYIPKDYETDYRSDPVWDNIDNNGTWDINTKWVSTGFLSGYEAIDEANSQFGNYLEVMGEQRIFPDHWVTALFPNGVASKTTTFGENTLVAQMTACTGYNTKMIDGKKYRIYHLKFELVDGEAIEANKPLLVKAGVEQTTPYQFYSDSDQEQDWFKTNASIDFGSDDADAVVAKDGAKIFMKGRYLPDQLAPGDFYFMHSESDGSDVYSFKRVPNQENAAMLKGCRCWWSVEQNNMRSVNVSASAASKGFFDGETTGIDELPTRVVIDGIYDLNGRKLDIKPEELPQGLYIMNGKKVVKK